MTPWLAPIVWEGTFDSFLIDSIYKQHNITIATTVFALGKWVVFYLFLWSSSALNLSVAFNCKSQTINKHDWHSTHFLFVLVFFFLWGTVRGKFSKSLVLSGHLHGFTSFSTKPACQPVYLEWWQILLLEFSSSLTHLNQLIKIIRITRNSGCILLCL